MNWLKGRFVCCAGGGLGWWGSMDGGIQDIKSYICRKFIWFRSIFWVVIMYTEVLRHI